MNPEETKDTETANANEVSNDTLLEAQRNQEGFSLSDLAPTERLEVMQSIMEAEAAVEALALPMFKSSEIIGIPLDILDATFKSIPDVKSSSGQKLCVNFLLRNKETGEQFTCLKGSNVFNDMYVNYFNKIRGIAFRPYENYQFVKDSRFRKNDNDSIVLRKIQPQMKSAN